MSRRNDERGPKVASPPETPEIALSLARAGWPVFPVTIYAGTPAEPKRHKVPAVKWKDEATTDEKTVAKWWAGEHSGRWIGVYAEKAGIVVLDVDPGGDESLAEAGLEIPETFNYPTHRKGGRHHVYAAPEGVELTIARNLVVDGKPLDGIDVRSGTGLMVYYGPALKKAPKLTPAPDWLLVPREATGQVGTAYMHESATEAAFRARLVDGKPPKKLRRLVEGVEFPKGAAHEPMLDVVAALVSEGVKGTPGVGDLMDATKERYSRGGADRPRDWDNAVAGSVKRFGLPPVTLALSKAERKAIAQRNTPEAIEERKIEKRAERVNRLIVDADDMSEDALAERFGEAVVDLWCNTPGIGLLHYDGRVWTPKEKPVLVDHARLFLRVIRAEQTRLAILRNDKPGEAAAKKLGQRSTISAVAELAAGAMLANAPALDAHPDLLNTPSGVVDLRTSELRPHDPMLYMTKITGAPYDPRADRSMWNRALEALPKKVGAALQVRLGQALTGYTPDDDKMLLFEGAGENGKTSWLIGMRMALGSYAVKVSDKLLLGDPSDHPTSLMSLQGARWAYAEELPEGHALNVKRLKDTVGTPEITARRMRQDEVTFRATHAFAASTNYRPIVAETDHGTWRRLALVSFPYKYVADPLDLRSATDRIGDPAVKAHFEQTPDAGLLRWLVEGARLWYENGRKMPRLPKKILADTESWRLDADPVLAYTRERLVRDPGYAITTADLAEDFNLWLERRGHRAWSQQTINSRFGGHVSMEGVERKTVKWSRVLSPSRPPSAILTRPIPKITTSWKGVRFTDDPRLGGEPRSESEVFEDLAKRAAADA